MCRLFGMTGGGEPVAASFWLLEAPDSLSVQSRREPDGTGLGVFDADGGVRGPQVADRVRGSSVRRGGPPRDLDDVRRSHPVRLDGRGRTEEHPSVRETRPPVRPQRRRGGARPTRGGARRGPLARGRRHRLRTGLRTDHETDRTRRRRRDRRARRRMSMDRRPSPAVRVEHRAHDRRRPVGTALPGHPPSLRPRAQCRRPAWRTPSRRGGQRPARSGCVRATSPPAVPSSSPASRWTRTLDGGCWHRANWFTSTPIWRSTPGS